MIQFPCCKINIGLSVVEKRTDGYHNIESIFYALRIEDALEIVPSTDGATQLHIFGMKPDCDAAENMVLKAYNFLKSHYDLPPLQFYLYKHIPFCAGLGGGSSDAACTIKMLNEMFSLKLSQQQMLDFASHIGSDCPFFIENRPSFVTGTGNILRSIDLSLSNYCIAVVKPPFFLSTAEMYRQITPKAPQHVLTETVKQPISEWKHLIFNDFEQYAFEKYPEIEQIKTTLYHHGALYASMSGSGSALFGIFEQPPIFHFPRDYQIFII